MLPYTYLNKRHINSLYSIIIILSLKKWKKDHIQKYVAKIIERANDSLLPDLTISLNELFGKTLASNLISEMLRNVMYI